MAVNMELGMIVPPVGLNLFIIRGIVREKLEEVTKGVVPFIAVFILVLIVIVVSHDLSLWLPTYLSE
ncbi:TRAP transporter large permease subunit [Neobacillus niacini]|uniref:TRAP transporter large permease subunit n=1 Tax=Neobacillus niacini TaxID=86668 RepID=UPI0005ED80AA|nr:TRAP transporter large permease subunit [Neobacillus niacini]